MSDKNFALKNLKLIPTDGYATIESDGTIEVNSPVYVNLNADTVAISTDLTIGGQVSSDLIVGDGYYVGLGTTNPTSKLDVVGNVKITGINTVSATVFTNQLNVSGVSTFAGITTVTGTTLFSKQLNVSGVSTFAGITTVTGSTLFAKQLNVSGVATITGNLNAAGNYYVKLARTTNQTITNGTDTLIGFSAVSDPNSWYSGITNRTTPTVAGTYHVDVMVNWQAGTVVNNQTNIQIRKNGNTFALSQVGIQTNFAYTQPACGIVTMNGTTDYIDFTVFTGNTTNQVVNGTADGAWTKMEIFKIN